MRRKSRKFVSSSAGIVDRVREMVEQSREEERGQEDREETMVGRETKYAKTDEVETFEFNKGRPAVDKRERRGVKRNLFGEGERRSSVNRRLRDQLKMKKQSLKRERGRLLTVIQLFTWQQLCGTIIHCLQILL